VYDLIFNLFAKKPLLSMLRSAPTNMLFISKIAFGRAALFLLIGSLVWPGVCLADGPEYDVRPVPVKTPPPEYPTALKREGVSGVVAVRVVIDETGAVAECSVVKSSNPEFNQPALDAVKKWKFKPAQKDGNPVKAKLLIPIQFQID
jgi:periplasmic protein TonB